MSTYFMSCNRNKRSVAIDLTSKHGVEVFHGLVETADVLIHNFLPSKVDKLRMSWEELGKINPRLVYANISGEGPLQRSLK